MSFFHVIGNYNNNRKYSEYNATITVLLVLIPGKNICSIGIQHNFSYYYVNLFYQFDLDVGF